MDSLGSCSRPRSGRRGSKEAREAMEARDKNLNLVDVYDIAADIGKVRVVSISAMGAVDYSDKRMVDVKL